MATVAALIQLLVLLALAEGINVLLDIEEKHPPSRRRRVVRPPRAHTQALTSAGRTACSAKQLENAAMHHRQRQAP